MKRIILVLAVLTLVVAACTPASSGSSDEATPTSEPTSEPTEEPADDPTEGAEPSLEEGAGELDAILPDEVGGLTIEYQHSEGEDVMGSEGVTPEAIEFFENVGAEPSDLSSAFGFASDAEAGSFVSLIAFRVEGADEGTLRDEFIATFEDDGTVIGEETSVGGKTVRVLGDDESGGGGYFYVKNDIVFIVGGLPEELAAEILSQLP